MKIWGEGGGPAGQSPLSDCYHTIFMGNTGVLNTGYGLNLIYQWNEDSLFIVYFADDV